MYICTHVFLHTTDIAFFNVHRQCMELADVEMLIPD